MGTKARYAATTMGRVITEQTRLQKLADAVAPQGGKWASDVLSRKRCISDGKGWVHGRLYNLEKDFGLTDAPVL